MDKAEATGIIKSLFDKAKARADTRDYIYTLVRVDGLSLKTTDPLIQLRKRLDDFSKECSPKELLEKYCSLILEEPLALLANILNCVQERDYNLRPFRHLWKESSPNFIMPTISETVAELIKTAEGLQNSDLVQLLKDAYPDEVLKSCDSGIVHDDALQNAADSCHVVLSALMDVYRSARLEFSMMPHFYKLPQFMVMELLTNDADGLYGFKLYFSNGSHAIFARYHDSTEIRNISLGVPLGFWVGSIDDLRKEWRVGDKRLYEIGLPGRYNNWGEWKPLIYPAEIAALEKEARRLSQDQDVVGVLLYMMCTGFRGIEFVVRTNIELPLEYVGFGNKMYLSKCVPVHEDQTNWIYDGWFELATVDPEYIREAIAYIGINVNRMAFAYEGIVDWRLKYRTRSPSSPYATPSEADLDMLDSMLKKFPQAKDAIILDSAIDWYNRGKSFRSPFAKFLHYYIAFESVAIAIAEGEADFGLGYIKESAEEIRKQQLEIIKANYKDLYTADPLTFVKQSYFEVLSIKKQTRRVAELAFGKGHRHIDALFEKTNGRSLSDIRGKLAHGKVTLIDSKDEELVRERLTEIAEISREFLVRLIFLLGPADALPTWSRHFEAKFSFTDPRSTLVASDERILPSKDWRIRPEWCEYE